MPSGSSPMWGILAPVHRLAPALLCGMGAGCVYGLTDLAPDDPLTDSGLPTSPTGGEDSGTTWVTFDTDTDEPTGGTPPGDQPPSIDSFTATEETSSVRLAFTVTDPDDDMDGGWVNIEVGGASQNLRWPQDINLTSSTQGWVGWSLGDFTPEMTETIRLTVEDATGRTDTATTDFTRSTPVYTATEVGDDLNDAVSLGEISVPAEIQGSIHSCGNAGGGYAADVDIVKFQVASSRRYQMELTWSDGGASDLDLWLLSSTHAELAKSATVWYPEQLGYDLVSGTVYQLFVGCWTGNPVSWTVTIAVL